MDFMEKTLLEELNETYSGAVSEEFENTKRYCSIMAAKGYNYCPFWYLHRDEIPLIKKAGLSVRRLKYWERIFKFDINSKWIVYWGTPLKCGEKGWEFYP